MACLAFGPLTCALAGWELLVTLHLDHDLGVVPGKCRQGGDNESVLAAARIRVSCGRIGTARVLKWLVRIVFVIELR
jgi:hypothetical protein